MERLETRHLIAAHERGFVAIRATKVAQLAGCSECSVRNWLNGERVSPELDASIRRAFGETLPVRAKTA